MIPVPPFCPRVQVHKATVLCCQFHDEHCFTTKFEPYEDSTDHGNDDYNRCCFDAVREVQPARATRDMTARRKADESAV